MMRVKKLKSTGAIGSCQKHNDRERYTPNADKSRTHLNKIIIGDKNKSYLDYFHEKTKGIKIRKNAVYAIEVFLSASREAKMWNNRDLIKGWVNDSINWLNKTFDKDNVVKVHFHVDETCPHLHAFVVPMFEGKLNCKKYLGGSKYRLSQYQSEYHEMVKKYDLERGIKGSQAKHQDVKKYYEALNQELTRELPKPKMFESKEKYKIKVDKEYQKVVLKNLDQRYKIEKLQGQLYLKKKKYKEPIDRKKSFVDRQIEKFQNERKPDALDKKIEEVMAKIKQESSIKEDENKKITKFLDKNPDLKNQIMEIMKTKQRDKGKER